MPILSLNIIKKWISIQTEIPNEIPIPEMNTIVVVEDVLSFSRELDNLQIRLVPRECTSVDLKLYPY